MTSSKTIVKAVIDGTVTDTTDTSPGRERPHGIIRVREDQVYYVTGLASAALWEADQLVKDIKDSASDLRVTRHDTNPADPLDMTHVLSVLGEALDCIDLASEVLSALSIDIRVHQHNEGP
jgi:hypothetical protein